MSSDAVLELREVDPPIWRVMVGDTDYGPYTLGQMRRFISERRVGLETLVTRGEGAFRPARTVPELGAALASRQQRPRDDQDGEAATSNFVVVSSLRGESSLALIRAMSSLGRFVEVFPGTFILRSRQKLARVQNTLGAAIGAADRFLVVDANHNRLAWRNLGPEVDVAVRSVWDREVD